MSATAEINRANAQNSTGPKTAEGQSKTSLNAVKTGLTGRTILLPSDDADAYRTHVAGYQSELSPVGPIEDALVQSLADTAWRLDRVVALEMNLYAHGHSQFAAEFEDHELSQRPGLIQLRTFFAYEKQIRNLHLQEARLRRAREKDTAKLQQPQSQRRAAEQAQLEEACRLYLAAKAQGHPFNSADHGFEFSTAKLEHRRKCPSNTANAQYYCTLLNNVELTTKIAVLVHPLILKQTGNSPIRVQSYYQYELSSVRNALATTVS